MTYMLVVKGLTFKASTFDVFFLLFTYVFNFNGIYSKATRFFAIFCLNISEEKATIQFSPTFFSSNS